MQPIFAVWTQEILSKRKLNLAAYQWHQNHAKSVQIVEIPLRPCVWLDESATVFDSQNTEFVQISDLMQLILVCVLVPSKFKAFCSPNHLCFEWKATSKGDPDVWPATHRRNRMHFLDSVLSALSHRTNTSEFQIPCFWNEQLGNLEWNPL